MDKNVVSWFQRGVPAADLEGPPSSQRKLTTGLSLIICTYKRAGSLKRFLQSLEIQERKPDRLVIVDASPDPETEQVIKEFPSADKLAQTLVYFRVRGPLQGLTRQRNFGLSRIQTDLVGFFDDDVILWPGCVGELEKAHRELGEDVAGVGAFIMNSMKQPSAIWRLRRLLRMVPSLAPGKYFASGISVPWSFLPETEERVEVDCLPGCAMTWKTAIVHQVGFHSGFDGYALGEDLDFSLRARAQGKLLLAGAARLEHLHAPSGRPDHYKFGYMTIYNTYHIHRRAMQPRSWREIAWFVYAWTIDTFLLGRHLLFPGRIPSTVCQFAGRVRGAFDVLRGR